MSQTCPSMRGYKWLIFALVSTPLVFNRHLAAADCGGVPAEYSAYRTTIIDQTTLVSKIFVSETKIREEQTGQDGRLTIVIRLPAQRINYVFDPLRKEGVQLNLPPARAGSTPNNRQTVDKRPDGSTISHVQLLTNGVWKDILTTTCRPDGVMIEQKFVIVDPQGNLLKGRLTQSDIKVGSLPHSLFEVPESVVIKRP